MIIPASEVLSDEIVARLFPQPLSLSIGCALNHAVPSPTEIYEASSSEHIHVHVQPVNADENCRKKSKIAIPKARKMT